MPIAHEDVTDNFECLYNMKETLRGAKSRQVASAGVGLIGWDVPPDRNSP